MGSYRLRPEARNDLDRIWEFTSENWGHVQAKYYLGAIEQACSLIASNPHIGRAAGEILAGLRVLIVKEHMLCYFIDDNHVDVARILHKRMNVDSRMP